MARELRMKEALEAEKEMREQINKYSKKYNELHNSLNNSNETFDKFKREMERVNSFLPFFFQSFPNFSEILFFSIFLLNQINLLICNFCRNNLLLLYFFFHFIIFFSDHVIF